MLRSSGRSILLVLGAVACSGSTDDSPTVILQPARVEFGTLAWDALPSTHYIEILNADRVDLVLTDLVIADKVEEAAGDTDAGTDAAPWPAPQAGAFRLAHDQDQGVDLTIPLRDSVQIGVSLVGQVSSWRTGEYRGYLQGMVGAWYEVDQNGAPVADSYVAVPLSVPITYSLDCDGDGDGVEASACSGPDCDDSSPLVHPGAHEYCDGRDNDCDGAKDESCSD